MQLQSTTPTPTSSAASSQYMPLVTQEERNSENLPTALRNIHENSIEALQAVNQATDSNLQGMRQALTRIETALHKNQSAGLTEHVLTFFIEHINKLNENLKQKSQDIEAAYQENSNLKKSLEVREKECEALRQELEANKQIREEKSQTEEKQGSASKPTLKDEVIQQLKGPLRETRENAIYAFRAVSDSLSEAEKQITPLLKNIDVEVRDAALHIIGHSFSGAWVRQELIPRLQDEEWKIRQATANLLCDRLSIPEIEQVIIPLLQDPAWQVRQTAIRVLSKRLQQPQARLKQAITPLLQDPQWQVQIMATILLRRF